MRTKTIYVCDICNEEYYSENKARDCEARGVPVSAVQVGDIVTSRAGFGWFNGDSDWIVNPEVQKIPGHGNCFSVCCTMSFYYVVTAVGLDKDSHKLQYHLFTLAMNENTGYHSGYALDTHCKPFLVDNPPERVVLSSKRLIGKLATRLI